MSGEIEAYVGQLDSIRGEAAETVRGMSVEELGWTPLATDTSSPTVLVTHMAGSESFWIHQVAGGIDVGRDRDSEFAALPTVSAHLVAALERAGETSRGVLRGLSGTDLDEKRPSRPGQDPVTIRYAILHQIDHMAQHLGHLALTHQLFLARG
jgi:uncharacterized damage-inducible protein DinB